MPKEYIILIEDRAWLEARIAELDQQITALGPEFYDVFNQSSETWHDNAPFDALRDRQSVLFAERSDLKNTLLKNTAPLPKVKKGVVGIGSIVQFDTGRKVLIAGHWTYRAGTMIDNVMVVSCQAPLAKALLGKTVGTATSFGLIRSVE